MKCSLEDGFINILLIILIAPSKGIELPLFLHKTSVLEKPMNFQQLRAAINRLQDLDSFPDDSNSENKLHKIVKKQMTFSDYEDGRKNKRSVFSLPGSMSCGAGDGTEVNGRANGKAKKSVNSFVLLEPNQYYSQKIDNRISEEIFGKIKDFAKEKQLYFSKRVKKKNVTVTKKGDKNKTNADSLSAVPNQDKQDPKMASTPQTASTKVTSTPQTASVKVASTPQTASAKMASTPQTASAKVASAQQTASAKMGSTQQTAPAKAASTQQTASAKVASTQQKASAKVASTQQTTSTKVGSADKVENGKGATLHHKETGKAAPKKETSAVKTREKETDKKKLKENAFLSKKCTKIPDEHDFRYYYECEASAFGCIKLKHKRCPDGQFFSFRYLKCLKGPIPHARKDNRIKRRTDLPYTKIDSLYPTPEEPEPANEWMDASQSVSKVPPEFKPKKAPGLKIYHLSVKRRLNELLGKTIEKRHILGKDGTQSDSYTNLMDDSKGTVKRHDILKHHPRSFLIRINKKSGKDSQDQSIRESDENDEEDEETEEEDDEDEDDDEEECEEETADNKENEKSSRKESLKNLLKSAKMAVTNRARFTEKTSDEPSSSQKSSSSSKSKKSEESEDSLNKNKKVLIDANIKVDSTISNALKYILKSKTKGKDTDRRIVGDDESLISDRGSQDQLDPELMRMYEHLIRNNPRVKRYFLSNCAKKKELQGPEKGQ